jgi:hypothetical protein
MKPTTTEHDFGITTTRHIRPGLATFWTATRRGRAVLGQYPSEFEAMKAAEAAGQTTGSLCTPADIDECRNLARAAAKTVAEPNRRRAYR